jgi:endonuclease/exonuclease/phosphatase (EEP) superfamily protein YafD
MALVTEMAIGRRTIVTYNLHLESRGNDELRRAQIEQVLRDVAHHRIDIPVILAGDFNLNISGDKIGAAIKGAKFINVFGNDDTPTTPRRSIFEDGRKIDWFFVRGPADAKDSTIHKTVGASDHFPISATVSLD